MNFSQLQGVRQDSSHRVFSITSNMLQECLPIVYIHPPVRQVPSTESCYKVKIVNVNISWISTLDPFTQHHLIFNIIEIVIAILGKKSSQNKSIKRWKITVKE